ncbi:monocarboxylate transporter 13-like isoform X2 [Mercenaria mercenaria]|uniref:monocarboxylate transporter 13-like isoform X2 n=1 Tax=Mercenaria mercenaria TaxID=6596 RepID=UPI00234EB869|nr:monocarboxylate transporter 13-like isoform X2 [Mercenaria mercenaria]
MPGNTKLAKNSEETSKETETYLRKSSANGNKASNNSSKHKDCTLLTPVPPDGGWGWVITLSSFMIGVIVDGIAFTFGIFFIEFQDYFGANKSTTSSINSVLTGTYLSIGPIAGALTNIFGCRKVAMAGAIITSISFFVCTFSPNVNVMIVLYGFCGGTGFGLMYLPAIVMVGYYFDKRRALATGIAVCGSGIGSFAFAPLSEALLSRYSWKGAMWILSAISLNGLVFAALFRPLEYTDTSLELVETCDEEIEIHADDNTSKPIYNPQLQRVKGAPENSIYRSRSLEACNQQNGSKDSDIARLGHSLFLDAEPRSRKHAKGRHVLRPLERKDIFYSGSVQNLPEYTAAANEEMFVRSMLKLDHSDTSSTKSTKISWLKLFSNTFDFSLLKSPTFVLYGLSCFLCMIGFFVPFIYIPDIAIEHGMSTSQTAWIISSIGIINTVARIAVGWVSDKPWADCILINTFWLIVTGVLTMFVPFYKIYAGLVAYAVLFGCGIGALFDATGNYLASFYLAGVVICLSGLICLPLRRLSRWEKAREDKKMEDQKKNDIETVLLDRKQNNGVGINNKQ